MEENKKLKEQIKILMIAVLVMFAFSAISLTISLLSYDELTLQLKDKLYILVMGVTIIIFVILLIIYLKNIKNNK